MHTLSFATLAAFAAIAAAQTSCPSAMPISLCCITLEPFSDNAYVWENVCGVTVPDTTILTASGCAAGTSLCGSQQYEDMYAACCQEYLSRLSD
ncbi:hypothetical protein EVJ58_g10 [Rhodofomes roseus]|uniref:Uncharacterized protein n=1 Tax=Rhodofomes roseus TaxID=34475 RepID=A0A4Y9Z7I9_9APHY|nr:hypothetical protein EVJ58_g10 [Rhodofomes roseus]